MRIVPVALVALILAGCSTSAPDAGLTVYAAASLKQPFTRIGQLYEEQHPGARVTFNFAGSSDLVAQLDHGAPADVLATADETTMTDAVGSGTATGPRIFATNTLQIVVPAGNPGGVDGFSDLTDPSLQVVVCAPHVRCGAATVRVEEDQPRQDAALPLGSGSGGSTSGGSRRHETRSADGEIIGAGLPPSPRRLPSPSGRHGSSP